MKKSIFGKILAVLLISVMLFAIGCSNAKAPEKGKEQAKYPSKNITFVVWSSAGSPLDVFMRQLAQAASKELGQNIVVENRTGGSGAVAMSYVQSLPADGYTILSTTGSMTFTMAEGKAPFKADDFQMLMTAQAEPSAIAVLSDSPLKTLEDFVKAMKEKPGKLSIGGYASGGFHNFVMHRFKKAAGFEATWVPFEGGNDALTALLGKHLDVAFLTPSTALSQIQQGKVRLLAISTPERSPNFPDVPTFKEKGYDVVEMLWRGVMAKKGIPDDVIKTLNDAFTKAMDSPEFKKYMKDLIQEEFRLGPDKMKELVNKEINDRTAFLKDLGLVK